MALRQDVLSKLQGMLQDAGEGDQLVRGVQEIMSYLNSVNLVTTVKIHPRHVGVHPSNRDSYGLNAVDVHDLIDSVVDVGFVWARVQSVGVEIENDGILQWSQKLVQSAGGMLGSLAGTLLKIASVCGSHTNFMLRLFPEQVVHQNEHVSVGGCLSFERLRNRDPAFYVAVTEGFSGRSLQRQCQSSCLWFPAQGTPISEEVNTSNRF